MCIHTGSCGVHSYQKQWGTIRKGSCGIPRGEIDSSCSTLRGRDRTPWSMSENGPVHEEGPLRRWLASLEVELRGMVYSLHPPPLILPFLLAGQPRLLVRPRGCEAVEAAEVLILRVVLTSSTFPGSQRKQTRAVCLCEHGV